MDKELFEQLTLSMKEAVAIAKGEMEPSRVFAFRASFSAEEEAVMEQERASIQQEAEEALEVMKQWRKRKPSRSTGTPTRE